MANFPRNGPVHGANGPDYDNSHRDQQRGPQAPRNTFGLTGTIARMIHRRANQMAANKMDYFAGMNEFLQRDQEYVQNSGRHQSPQQAEHDAQHGVGNTHETLQRQIRDLQGQIQSMEEFFEQTLMALNAKIDNGGRTPVGSVAGDERPDHGFGQARWQRSQRAPSEQIEDEYDAEDTPEMRPPLPTVPRPVTGADASLPQEPPALPARTNQRQEPPALPERTSRQGNQPIQQRREFAPPPLHPSHPRAQERNRPQAATVISADGGIDIETWRNHATSLTADTERDDDNMTDITTTTGHRRPAPRPTSKPVLRKPLPGVVPGLAAGTDDHAKNQQATDLAATMRANADVETRIKEEGRKTAIHITR